MVTPTPRFEFVDAPILGDHVELTLGEDFVSFLLVPRALHEVDALARAALPARDGASTGQSASEPRTGLAEMAMDALRVRAGSWLPTELRTTVDGRRPDGSACS